MITSPRRLLASAVLAAGATTMIAPAAFADSAPPPSTPAPSNPTPSNPTPSNPTPSNPTPSGSAPAHDSPASTPRGATTLADVKARAASAISARTEALQKAITDVQSNKYLTSSDRAAILSILNSDLQGLNALAPVIQADTTVSQARSDTRTIFTKYRVFALALPQARFVAATDDLTGTVIPRLTDAQTRLGALLTGRDSAKNTAAVQAAMADLGDRIKGITSDTSGVAATVVAYTPAEWNANHSLLSGPRSKLQDARSDARSARGDVRTVVQAIRS